MASLEGGCEDGPGLEVSRQDGARELRQGSCLPCLSRLFSSSCLSVQPRALLVKECQGDRDVRERIGATKKTLTFAFSSSTGAEHRRRSSLVCFWCHRRCPPLALGVLIFLFVSDGGVEGWGGERSWLCSHLSFPPFLIPLNPLPALS